MANTKRMNRLEELGRVDSEKAYTSKGKKNLAAEKKRIVGEMKMKSGGVAASKMGKVKTSSNPDGVAVKGRTKGTMVKMAAGGESKAMVKKEMEFMKKKGAPKSMVKHEMEEAGMKKMRYGGKC
jgi:hypothetical protein